MSEAAIVLIVLIVSVFLSFSVVIVAYVVFEYAEGKQAIEMAKLAAAEEKRLEDQNV